MHKCYETEIAGFPIRMYQSEHGFAVQYGVQLNTSLTYTEACQELGASIMHALVCEGKVTDTLPSL